MKIRKQPTNESWWQAIIIVLVVVLGVEIGVGFYFWWVNRDQYLQREIKDFLVLSQNFDEGNRDFLGTSKKQSSGSMDLLGIWENGTENEIKLFFVGDVMLGRTVNTRQLKHGDMNWAWEKVGARLRAPDITMVNLETPIITHCPSTDEGMIFCAPPETIVGLTGAGVDVVTVANNHTLNHGAVGLQETKAILTQAGIEWTGPENDEAEVSKLVIKEVKGVKIGFLGFDDVSQTLDEEKVMLNIQNSREKVGLLVVNWHWGSEYTDRPNARQTRLARSAVDSGADIIIGHHPHWVQSKEIYAGKPIYYSLGNFIFDQMWSEETKKGLAVEFTYQGTELTTIEEMPIYIENYGQPSFSN